MARKIRAKLIMGLRDQGVSRRAIASTRRMSMESACEVFNIAAERQIAWGQVRDMPDDEVHRGRPIEVLELTLRTLPPGSQRRGEVVHVAVPAPGRLRHPLVPGYLGDAVAGVQPLPD